MEPQNDKGRQPFGKYQKLFSKAKLSWISGTYKGYTAKIYCHLTK